MEKYKKFNLTPNINKHNIFKKLHISENTESYKNADGFFDELNNILKENMNITVVYAVVEKSELKIDLVLNNNENTTNFVKYVICFVSSKDEINNKVNDMMSSGNYLKGYLLNEMSSDVIFNCSNELNKIIKSEFNHQGLILSKRYAAGDEPINLKYQKTILNLLKSKINVNANLTENYMIMPEKSLLYFYGLSEIKDSCCLNNIKVEDDCSLCSNKNCLYRNVK